MQPGHPQKEKLHKEKNKEIKKERKKEGRRSELPGTPRKDETQNGRQGESQAIPQKDIKEGCTARSPPPQERNTERKARGEPGYTPEKKK